MTASRRKESVEFNLALGIDVLRRTPATLRSLLDGLPEPWIRGTEGPGTFSPFDNIGHLIDGEETDWVPRARLILAKGASIRFEPYDRFRHRARNAGRSLGSLLEEFARLRAANLALLESWNLGTAELDLPGEHPGLGPVTLRELLAAWVVHDLGHIAQVARVMAKQYLDEVGPWVPFLPVLTDRPGIGA
ncbi:MAG TPA: DinB family protein [Gemmatimonadales bacterium]|nr:DinB family protein [Gemmatimonadales bacterium]